MDAALSLSATATSTANCKDNEKETNQCFCTNLTNSVGLISEQSSKWEDTLGYQVPWNSIANYFTQKELSAVSQCSRRMRHAAIGTITSNSNRNNGNSGWRVHFVGSSWAMKPMSTMVDKMTAGKFLSLTMQQGYGAYTSALYSTPIAKGVHTLNLFGSADQQRFAWRNFKFPDLRRLRINSKLLNETDNISNIGNVSNSDKLPQLDQLTIHVSGSQEFIPLKIGIHSPKCIRIIYPTATEIGWWKISRDANDSAIELLSVTISVAACRSLINHRIHEFLEGFHAYSPKTKISLLVRGSDCTLDKVGDFHFAKYVTVRGWCKQFNYKNYKVLKSIKCAENTKKSTTKKVKFKSKKQQPIKSIEEVVVEE